jgi:hypothetical protein
MPAAFVVSVRPLYLAFGHDHLLTAMPLTSKCAPRTKGPEPTNARAGCRQSVAYIGGNLPFASWHSCHLEL